MNKRTLFGALTLLPIFATIAKAAGKTGTYTVPAGINLIRVKSYIGDKEVLDTHFRVEPGQKFVIEAVQE